MEETFSNGRIAERIGKLFDVNVFISVGILVYFSLEGQMEEWSLVSRDLNALSGFCSRLKKKLIHIGLADIQPPPDRLLLLQLVTRCRNSGFSKGENQ